MVWRKHDGHKQPDIGSSVVCEGMGTIGGISKHQQVIAPL